MNIALLTFNTDSYKPLADLTLPTKQKYCDRYGMTLEHLNSIGKDQSWYNPTVFLDCLEKYDAVLFVECDAAIINQDFDIRTTLQNNEFVITEDMHGLNAGVFMGRSTNLLKQFFYVICTQGPMYFGNHPWKNQEAMKHWLRDNQYSKMVTYMPQNFMNSYLNGIYPLPEFTQGNYKEGDWIVHLPGRSLEERCQIFRERFGL